MLIYYRIIPWIIQYEFVLDSRMHLHLWDRRAGDAFWSTDVSAFDFWGILQMLSRHLVYLHLSSLTSADAFQTGGHINLHLHLLFFCFADAFPVSGVSYLAFILSCRYFPGIWCILSCFYFELQILSGYLLYLHLSSMTSADAFRVSAVSTFVFCDFRRCFPDRGTYEFASPLAFILSCRCFPGRGLYEFAVDIPFIKNPFHILLFFIL